MAANSMILDRIAAGPQTNYARSLMGVQAFKDRRAESKLQRNRMSLEIDEYKRKQADREDAKHVYDITRGAIGSGSPQQARAVMEQYMKNDPNIDDSDRGVLGSLLQLPDENLMAGLQSINDASAKEAGIMVPKIKTPEDYTLSPGQQRRRGGTNELLAEAPPTPTKSGGDKDKSAAAKRLHDALYNEVVRAGFGNDATFDPTTGSFVIHDEKLAAKATGITEKAWKLWKEKYESDPYMFPEAALEALREYQTPIPDARGNVQGQQKTFGDMLREDYGSR